MKYLWSTAAALAFGCSSTPVDVGSNYAGEGEVGGWTEEKACAAGPQLPIVGTWTGYSELPRNPSGSNAVRLVISHATGQRVCGTITFGREAAPWPLATDSEVAYPPDLATDLQLSFGTYLARLEGLPRTITRGWVGLPRVTFRASFAQWKDWCRLQTSYRCEDVATAEYYCVPASGSGGLAPRVNYEEGLGCVTDYKGEKRTVDCAKAMLCVGGPCTCTATGCTAPPLWGNDYDLEFRGNSAVGDGIYLTRTR
jgi:hypothetical protein